MPEGQLPTHPLPAAHSPWMRPLAAPGMPSISVTLFMVKYSSQVALRKREVQKSSQSLEPTVSLPSTTTLVQRSNPWRERVLFPSRQILGALGAQQGAASPAPPPRRMPYSREARWVEG